MFWLKVRSIEHIVLSFLQIVKSDGDDCLFVIQTIDIDDFFGNTPEDTDNREYNEEGQPFDFSRESSSESLEPLAEAAVLAQFGRYDEAVETLLDEFDSNEGNCDEVATKTLEYLNKELDMESTRWLYYCCGAGDTIPECVWG